MQMSSSPPRLHISLCCLLLLLLEGRNFGVIIHFCFHSASSIHLPTGAIESDSCCNHFPRTEKIRWTIILMAYRWKGTSSFDDDPLWLLQDRAGTVGAQRLPCHLPLATGTGILLPWVNLLTAETEMFSQQKEITRALKTGALKAANPCAQMCGTMCGTPHMIRPFWVNKH